MAKQYPYIVVYVYAPEQYKEDYLSGKEIPSVKIGETGSEKDDCKTCMKAAMKRIEQQSTSFGEYMYLLQWFVFPFKKGTDNEIRDILSNEIYHLTSSKKIDLKKNKDDNRITKIGKEFVYNVNIAQVNTAISVYKLKAKMEELIHDRGIDPAFKKRLKRIVPELLSELGDVIDESGQSYKTLPVHEKMKIFLQSNLEEIE